MPNPVRRSYDILKRIPGGKTVFSRMIGHKAPYSSTIRALVREVDEGYARVEMRDRRAVRNHLDCVHAVALFNLAELTTGVAFMYGLPDGARGILTGLSIDYLKKARGTLTAECRCPIPESTDRREYEIETEIRDRKRDVVARSRARWLVGPES